MLKHLALLALTTSSSTDNQVEGASVGEAALKALRESGSEAMLAGVLLGRYPPAPVVETTQKPRKSSTGSYVPVVLVHGLGDSHNNPGMLSLVKSVETTYEGAYAISASVPDSIMSYLTPVQEQIDILAAQLKSDPVISAAGRIVLVGLSQGGIISRGYTQQFSGLPGYPKVVNLVSLCGVINGEFGCPGQVTSIIPELCEPYQENPYHFFEPLLGNFSFSFQGYTTAWRNESMYLSQNTFLPYLNNEIQHSNSSAYKSRILALEKYVMIGATEDTVIIPWWAEQMGGWQFDNPNQEPYYFTDSPQYTKDLTGLATLHDTGRLFFDHFKGDHLQFNTSYWDGHILPYLGVEA